MNKHLDFDAEALFGAYMKLCDVPRLENEETPDPLLSGKKLGLVNGSAWIQLWSYYFGRLHLPGVKLVNAGNEGIQLNFMKAHAEGRPCPPQINIDLFGRYAKDLVDLVDVDAILITCSTMNRSLPVVRKAVEGSDVPVIQIDEPMMESAVAKGGNILVIATHGPTVKSTQQLLEETAERSGRSQSLCYFGATVEEAFHLLGEGNISGHNKLIADTIRQEQKKNRIDQVVLAQLSMSAFSFTYPNPEEAFGIPVLNSGNEGFKKIRQIFMNEMSK